MVVTVLAAILGIELIVLAAGRRVAPLDVVGGMVATVAGLAVALLAQAAVRALARRARRPLRIALGAAVHTAIAAYLLSVTASVDAPFGWLLGVLFGAAIGAALPTLAFGPTTGWAPAIAATHILLFVAFVLLSSALG